MPNEAGSSQATRVAPILYPLAGKTVWVAGHNGMVGSAIVCRLVRERCKVIIADRKVVDLKRQDLTQDWIFEHKPDARDCQEFRVWAGTVEHC